MHYLQSLITEINPVRRPVDPAKVSPLNRVGFATGLAQAAFRGAYASPAHAKFVDRTPVEIAIIRAAMWGGAK